MQRAALRVTTGPLVALTGVIVIELNHRRYVHKEVLSAAALAQAVEVDADSVSAVARAAVDQERREEAAAAASAAAPAGRLVIARGRMGVQDPHSPGSTLNRARYVPGAPVVCDDMTGVCAYSMLLRRKVEMLQWERSGTVTESVTDPTTGKKTTLEQPSFRLRWSERTIKHYGDDDPAKAHRNPPFPMRAAEFAAPTPRLGALRLSPAQTSRAADALEVPLPISRAREFAVATQLAGGDKLGDNDNNSNDDGSNSGGGGGGDGGVVVGGELARRSEEEGGTVESDRGPEGDAAQAFEERVATAARNILLRPSQPVVSDTYLVFPVRAFGDAADAEAEAEDAAEGRHGQGGPGVGRGWRGWLGKLGMAASLRQQRAGDVRVSYTTLPVGERATGLGALALTDGHVTGDVRDDDRGSQGERTTVQLVPFDLHMKTSLADSGPAISLPEELKEYGVRAIPPGLVAEVEERLLHFAPMRVAAFLPGSPSRTVVAQELAAWDHDNFDVLNLLGGILVVGGLASASMAAAGGAWVGAQVGAAAGFGLAMDTANRASKVAARLKQRLEREHAEVLRGSDSSRRGSAAEAVVDDAAAAVLAARRKDQGADE